MATLMTLVGMLIVLGSLVSCAAWSKSAIHEIEFSVGALCGIVLIVGGALVSTVKDCAGRLEHKLSNVVSATKRNGDPAHRTILVKH